MCAINGCTGSNEQAVHHMNSTTVHRGPDGTRVWTNGRVTLGFNRLAIIDLSERSMQPMHRFGALSIVFNGEIYNFKELRAELSDFTFESDGDAEVILAAYRKWGNAAFAKLNGMFALALYDSERDELVLARDPVGIKPLYYAVHEGRLWFSSEATTLFSVVPRTVNRKAVGDYLRLLYVPGKATLIEKVERVLPGEIVTFAGGVTKHTRIEIKGTNFEGTYADACALTRVSVSEAIARQLVSDRSVGLFLSGGIDSSVVASVASAVHPEINTYSVRFSLEDVREDEKFNADADRARESAKHFGTRHHEYTLGAEEAVLLFPQAVKSLHQPVGNATALAQLFLSQKAKDTTTVVLTGDGGDELFGGYERYRLALRAQALARYVPRFAAARLPHPFPALHLSGGERYAQLMFQNVHGLVPHDPDPARHFAQYFESSEVVRALMQADEENWLVDEALLRTDAMTMAASLEARVPFLDLHVRALAHALPREFLVTRSTTKRVLRDAFRDVLPAAVLAGPKRGWYSPGAKWLRSHAFVPLVEDLLSTQTDLLDMSRLRVLFDAHVARRAYHYPVVWAAFVLLQWTRTHKLS